MLCCGKRLSPKAVWPRKEVADRKLDGWPCRECHGSASVACDCAECCGLPAVQTWFPSVHTGRNSRCSLCIGNLRWFVKNWEAEGSAQVCSKFVHACWLALSEPAHANFVEASLCAKKDLQPKKLYLVAHVVSALLLLDLAVLNLTSWGG